MKRSEIFTVNLFHLLERNISQVSGSLRLPSALDRMPMVPRNLCTRTDEIVLSMTLL